jgi:hypothetical protein
MPPSDVCSRTTMAKGILEERRWANCGGGRFFLSRNEALVGQEDPHWYLVLCAAREDETDILGWCRPQRFTHLLPTNTDPDGVWVSCRLSIPVAHLEPGLPLG